MWIKEIKQTIMPALPGWGWWVGHRLGLSTCLWLENRQGRREAGRDAGCVWWSALKGKEGSHWLVSFVWSAQGSKGQTLCAKMKVDLKTLCPGLLGCQAALRPWFRVEDSQRNPGQDCKPITSLTWPLTPPLTIAFKKRFLSSLGPSLCLGNSEL